uniref:Uncharacterized protein n=1 Tax=Rhizophora mucronata TaxID=61149 RepID=A0A2P2P048_RHIMU
MVHCDRPCTFPHRMVTILCLAICHHCSLPLKTKICLSLEIKNPQKIETFPLLSFFFVGFQYL